MAATSEVKTWLVAFALWMVLTIQLQYFGVSAEPQVPCFFIFGDSLADNGNNNKLPTVAKVNYLPYGIDFPDGPTGRFTNGRTTVDILAELLGFEKRIPPYAYAKNSDILEGVNYASGTAGILRKTGKHAGQNVDFRNQLKNHQKLVSRLVKVLGNETLAKERLNKCLYWVELGNNDYINNYYLPDIYPSSSIYTPQQFANLLIDNHRDKLQNLYGYGARKVALVGLGQIGCTPNSISVYGTNGSACVDYMNDAVQIFNKKLVALVDQLNKNFTDAQFIYINTYAIGSEVPAAAGFKVWDVGCCVVNNIGQCAPSEIPCENRSEYVFWDSYHSTETLNLITANRVYNSSDPTTSYPTDVNHLVQSSPAEHFSVVLKQMPQ